MIKSLERLESVLPLARRLSRRSTFTLDESALCASCQPDARTWRPVFKIQLPGEAPRELSLGEDDLLLLDAFLKGADRYKSSHDEEGPMSTQVGRLRALLLGEESDSDEDADE